jgi:HK97 family phage prohead protease
MEKRIAPVSPDSNRLVGYAAVYGSLSEDLGGFREQIRAGAFDGTLKAGHDVRALFDHSTDKVLGRVSNGTLRLASDSTGLRVEIDLPEGVSYAEDLRKLIGRGDISQMSFGFVVPPGGDSWERRADGVSLRTLNQIELHEVSVVSIPAYPDTTIALRSLANDFQRRRFAWLQLHAFPDWRALRLAAR